MTDMNRFEWMWIDVNRCLSIWIDINRYEWIWPIWIDLNGCESMSIDVCRYESIWIDMNPYESIWIDVNRYELIDTVDQYRSVGIARLRWLPRREAATRSFGSQIGPESNDNRGRFRGSSLLTHAKQSMRRTKHDRPDRLTTGHHCSS